MRNEEFDVVVIGGGSAGLVAASGCNALGARVCLIEKRRLGGDCTWFGCVPSKALIRAASVLATIGRMREFGLSAGRATEIDASGVMRHVREVVARVAAGETPEVFEKRGITVVRGSPSFRDGSTVEVASRMITASRFIISTGAHPVVPPIEGLREMDYLTNETVFDLERLPASMIVLGGGPIGVELSQALSRLGVKVSVVEMAERILSREDPDLSRFLRERLESEGVRLLTGRKAVRFSAEDARCLVRLEGGGGAVEEIEAERVLAAVGRAPNLQGLSLEKAGVGSTKRGITVNAYLQTTAGNIFACGDVVGPYMFTHIAAYQAEICVRNALFRSAFWQKASYANVPWATFTEPELAHLGMTEEEARRKVGDVRVYTNPYGCCDRAVTDLEEEGMVKVITDRRGRILGAHVAGARASEVVQGFLIAKARGIPLSKLSSPIFIYPTLSEIVKKTAAKPLLEKLERPLIKRILRLMRSV